MIKVCHLSTVHNANDTRIFFRECNSLAEKYEVFLIANNSDKIASTKVKVIFLKRRKSRFLRLFLNIPLITIYALKLRADIFHIHDPELIFTGMLLKILGKKVIIDIHEDYSSTILHKKYLSSRFRPVIQFLFSIFYFNSIKFFDRVVVAWPQIGFNLKKIGIESFLIRNLPTINANYQLKNKDTFSESLRFVYCGLINDVRGIEEMINFIKCLREKGKVVSLDLYGPIVNSDMVKKVVADANSEKIINYKGIISPHEVEAALLNYDFGFVFFHNIPNHLHSEPNKVFEYFRSGVIPVVSDLPKLSEIINNAKSGLVVDINNIEDSVIKFLDFLKMNALSKLINNGYLFIKENNWDNEAKKLIDLYVDLIEEI